MGLQALTRARRSSIATRFSVDAAWTRELHQVCSQGAEEEVPDHVDALFVGEYEPVRYAAADKSAEKRAVMDRSTNPNTHASKPRASACCPEAKESMYARSSSPPPTDTMFGDDSGCPDD